MAVLTDRRETPGKKPESGFSRDVKKSVTAWVYILPAGLLMLIITLLPQIFQIWMAFTDYAIKNLRFNPFNPETTQFAPSLVGLQNFIDILQNNLAITNYNFGRLLLFNIVWTIANLVFHVGLGVLIAVALTFTAASSVADCRWSVIVEATLRRIFCVGPSPACAV